MSQDDGRTETLRRTKDTPKPRTTPPSLDELPTGMPLQKASAEQEASAPVEPERARLDSEALLAELNNMDPDELGRLMSAGAPKRFRPGDKVSGEVVRVRGNVAFIDIGAKSEAALSFEDGDEAPAVGDTVEAFVLRADGGGIQISHKLGGSHADLETLEEAMAAEIPVEGHVVKHNAGGFTVKVGQVTAFCPRSQIDRIVPEELEGFLNKTYSFLVIDIEGSKVVLSRRRILEAELEKTAAELWEKLAPGDAMDGIVANVRDFGVFVDLGGIQGLVSKRELGWDPDEATLPKRGQSVRVRILEVDKARKRVSLSMKDPAFSPWNKVGTDFIEGGVYAAKVVRITDFGAFLQLYPGVEGLCHISNIASTRTENAGDVLTVGESVRARLLGIDHGRRRLDLGIKQASDANYTPTEPSAPAPTRAPASLGTMGDLFSGLSLGGAAKPKQPSRKKSKKKRRR